MVQTSGQQTGDKSPSGRGILQGVTAECDTFATSVSSGNTLKYAVSAPSTEHSATIPEISGSGREGLVSPAGAGSPTLASVSIPRGIIAHPLGIVSQARNGARMTDSPRATEGCSGIEGAVGGVASAAHHALYSAPPRRHPVSQPIVFGDLSSSAVTVNLGSQSGLPNLFGLPAPVYAGTVPDVASNTAPTAAARTRSAPTARIDKSGTETALQDQCLANYEAKLRQEGSLAPVSNAMASANILHGAEYSQMVYPVVDSTSNTLRVGETVSTWTHHQERTHRLCACVEQPSVGSHYVSKSVPRVSTRSVSR